MPVAISSPISSPPAFQHLLFDLPEPEPPSVIQVRPQTAASPRDLGFGILSHYCGPELIDRVLAQHGRADSRAELHTRDHAQPTSHDGPRSSHWSRSPSPRKPPQSGLTERH